MIRSTPFTFSSLRSFRSASLRHSIIFYGAPGRFTSFRSIRQTFIRSAHKFRQRTQEKLIHSLHEMQAQFHFVLDLLLNRTDHSHKQIHSTPFHAHSIFIPFLHSASLAFADPQKPGLEKLVYNGIKQFDCIKIMATFKSSIDIVPVTGDYWCTSDRTHIHLAAGTKFPPCPDRDHHSINYWTNVNPFPPPPPPPIPDHLHERFSVMLRIEGAIKRVQIRPFRRSINLHLIPSQYTISVVNQTYDDLYQDHHGWHLKHHHSDVRLLKELVNEINKHYSQR